VSGIRIKRSSIQPTTVTTTALAIHYNTPTSITNSGNSSSSNSTSSSANAAIHSNVATTTAAVIKDSYATESDIGNAQYDVDERGNYLIEPSVVSTIFSETNKIDNVVIVSDTTPCDEDTINSSVSIS